MLPGDDPEARAEFLESSAGQIERLDWLAQNLLELSKLDSGLVLLDLRPDDLRAAVESAAHQLDTVAARRGVILQVDLPPTPVRIRHDPPRIGQVVANLVGNALVHTPPGTPVQVTVTRNGSDAVLEVHDDGPGMAEPVAARAFERFYRADPARSRHAGGSGLGLSIVKAIVQAHGGTVGIVTGDGRGTTVRVSLPLTGSSGTKPSDHGIHRSRSGS